MKRCRRTGWCRDCPDRPSCPAKVRQDRRARRSKQMSAAPDRLRRAAEILAGGWFTAEALGLRLYGKDPQTALERKSLAVRGRRMANRLNALGLLVVRPGVERIRSSAFTLVPGGLEELPC